jgi:H+-transporting ATPase
LTEAISDAPKTIKFVPFDPATKMSEATATDLTGSPQRIVKGASAVVIGLVQPSPAATAAANELEAKGFRVPAVAVGSARAMKLAGLIALSDPPRPDSAALITELYKLGVRTVMVTGDAPATAAIVAKAVGLDGAICPPGPIPDAVHPEQLAVFAGVLPEDKYKLVKAAQKGGHTIGMCSDGANDALALRQAQIGLAVSTATDVAKSAPGMVQTEPGLAGIRRQGRSDNVPVHPELHAELDCQEDSTGAFPGDRPDHDRTSDPDALADGPHHDHGRLPRHVVDDRQCPAVAHAECVADRQSDSRRRHYRFK